MPVEVLSYDSELNAIVPKKIVNWFDNGRTDQFLQFTVAHPAETEERSSAARRIIRSAQPGGCAKHRSCELGIACCRRSRTGSRFPVEAILGGLMGDGALSPTPSGHGARYRFGHCAKQAEYADWKGFVA